MFGKCVESAQQHLWIQFECQKAGGHPIRGQMMRANDSDWFVNVSRVENEFCTLHDAASQDLLQQCFGVDHNSMVFLKTYHSSAGTSVVYRGWEIKVTSPHPMSRGMKSLRLEGEVHLKGQSSFRLELRWAGHFKVDGNPRRERT